MEVFEDVGAFTQRIFTVTAGDYPERVSGVSINNPVPYFSVVGLILLAAALASYLPARRARGWIRRRRYGRNSDSNAPWSRTSQQVA